VSRSRWFDNRERNRGEYASKEEFVSLFQSERMALQRLALLLTANSNAADRCLALAFRECIASSSVSKDWTLAWARRLVIRNAINLMVSGEPPLSEMDGYEGEGSFVPSAGCSEGPMEDSQPILGLNTPDRFVFVICVLERYSIHDCALLLDKSPQDICEARQKAINQIEQINESSDSSLRLVMG